MNKAKYILLLASLLLLLSACGSVPDEPPRDESTAQQTEQQASNTPTTSDTIPSTTAPTEEPEPPTEVPSEKTENTEEQETDTMTIMIGTYQFTVLLENNDTAAALKAQLPLQLSMSELNGSEKYNYLPFHLPTNSYAPGQIQAGDVMLYGDSCLVVFYKSFPSSYSYTRIGHIADLTELQEAVGAGNVQMTFAE